MHVLAVWGANHARQPTGPLYLDVQKHSRFAKLPAVFSKANPFAKKKEAPKQKSAAKGPAQQRGVRVGQPANAAAAGTCGDHASGVFFCGGVRAPRETLAGVREGGKGGGGGGVLQSATETHAAWSTPTRPACARCATPHAGPNSRFSQAPGGSITSLGRMQTFGSQTSEGATNAGPVAPSSCRPVVLALALRSASQFASPCLA